LNAPRREKVVEKGSQIPLERSSKAPRQLSSNQKIGGSSPARQYVRF
jgi:hypothetical protein